MSAPQISFKTRGLEEVTEYIDRIGRSGRGIASEAVAEWFLGNGRRGLKHYPPYKYITRKRAYGKTFVSDRQRRFVMAQIMSGRIDPGAPHRTGNIQRAWVITGRGVKTTIENDAEGVKYVMGTGTQARQPKMVGWRDVMTIIASNIKGAIRHAEKVILERARKR